MPRATENRVEIFFKEQHAGYIRSILSGKVGAESRWPPGAAWAERGVKKIAFPLQYHSGTGEDKIVRATIDAGHIAKLQKIVAVGKIMKWKEGEKRAGKGKEKWFGENFVRVEGHPQHKKGIFLTPFKAREVAARGSRTIDEKMPGVLRVELEGKGKNIVSRAFRTWQKAQKIKEPRPTLVLYRPAK